MHIAKTIFENRKNPSTDKKFVIYKWLFNNPGHDYHGFVYIGLTNNLKQRTHNHINRKDNTIFHNMLLKYCDEVFWVLEEIDFSDTIKEVIEKEIFWIKKYKSNFLNEKYKTSGFNMTDGGDISPMLIPAIAEKCKKRLNDPDIKAKLEMPRSPCLEETKQKISEANTIVYRSPELRELVSTNRKKYFEEHPEARKAISQNNLKRLEDPEYLSFCIKNITSPDAKEKSKIAQQTPEVRQKMSDGQKEVWNEPGRREKQAKRLKDNPPMRTQIGLKNYSLARRKFSDEKVLEIKTKLANGVSVQELSKEYNAGATTIKRIRANEYAVFSCFLITHIFENNFDYNLF